MKTKFRLLAVAALLVLSTGARGADRIRLYGCDDPVQSSKRGICENKMSADDFRAIAPGVSWYYNWHFKTEDSLPPGVKMEFVPMLWTDSPDRYDGLVKYLSTHKASAVLSLNEPNLKGQAFMSPELAAMTYAKTKAIADRFHLPTIGPNMALGSPTGDSISADDPIEKKHVTYTFMVPYLKAFNYYMGNMQVPAVAFHSYGNLGEMTWAVGMLEKEFKKPVWVTEFAQWHQPDDAAALKYLVQATDLLERTKNVQAYSWFKERVGDNPRISLFEQDSGKLSPLGEAYVKMPVHDANVYYKLPGKLSAGRYVGMTDMRIEPSDDDGGFVDMIAEKDGATVDYNLHADASIAASINIRTKGAGNIAISKGGKPLATVPVTGDGWQIVTLKVLLNRGEQTIRVACTQADQRITSLEFTK